MAEEHVAYEEFANFHDALEHYGVKRRSGRYPWGSGGNSQQSSTDFLEAVNRLKAEGLSEAEITKYYGLKSTTNLRALKSIAKAEKRAALESEALRLKERGWSNVAIGERMGINESSVRSLLNPSIQANNRVLESTAEMLRTEVSKQGYLDIGAGTEQYAGVSKDRLRTSVAILEQEGYKVQYVKVDQLGTGKQTTIKVLTPPGTTYSELYKNQDKIGTIASHSDDGGRTYLPLREPTSVNSKRIQVKYGSEGGSDMDGVIEIRRGVDDLNLGNAKYAQVRIAVDKTHYLKGMAMYADDLPDGVDIRFNTNKEAKGSKLDALKPMKTDNDGNVDVTNPFGATIKPGGQRGALNIVNEEGDWGEWSRNLSSQMLSKQSPTLAKQQLDVTYKAKKDELDEIMALSNPAVKKKLLESFADDVDSSSVHLKAAALPRQATQVILPITSIKDTEIFAPNFRDGESVVLIRYPHGGTFEIPELKVNNKNADANRLLKQAQDAVGINPKVAAQLSGADFDGDTVLVIPQGSKRAIKTSAPLEALKGFDPQTAYPAYEGMKPMSARTKQLKMGDVSNLITDMTIQGANPSEIARAVKHSMVVIDAEKHKLNWKQSALDNGIAELKEKYQGSARAGAATLISKASSEERVLERKDRPASEGGRVDAKTGERRYVETGASYVDRNGKTVRRTQSSTKMAEVSDARTLIGKSNTVMENIYADHANKLKAMANDARLASIQVKPTPYSPSAKKTYQAQVDSLNSKLNVALKNAPLERKAQLVANSIVNAKRQANPDMDAADLKKIKSQALAEARVRTGANKQRVEIGWDEWNAIQAGAISNHKLTQILNHADLDQVKQLATPRERPVMTDAKTARAQAMLASGYTQAEIADHLGIPTSTLNDALKG